MSHWYDRILEQYYKERNTGVFYKTSGFAKLWFYFLNVIDKDDFRAEIGEMRKKYQIPKEGYSTEDKESWTRPPEEWPLYKERHLMGREIKDRMKELCKRYGLLYRDWGDLMENYLFFNNAHLSLHPVEKNLVVVSDGKTRYDSQGKPIDDEVTELYPVTLHISPHASRNDILDYIEKLYSTEILPLQKKYRSAEVKIGLFRKRSRMIRDRDNFIYENRELPRKEIVRLVMRKFPDVADTVDEGSVGKLISLEIKRRK